MVPFHADDEPGELVHEGEACAICGDDAVETAYFAKSY
jgi:prolyl-tRNA synthetase